MVQISDIWLFQDGLAIRIVGLQLWHDVALQMAKSLNAHLSEGQKKQHYEYIVILRDNENHTSTVE